ncbi:MAG: PTS glucose transporter subunit IIA [Clostridia bacterium]|nr:PTS glucose transporter subunit IIA [Clostridia bacterium]MBQ9774272.1 PTS glucose transporter subunit IIA [Clostridia bacterium]
MLFSKKQIGLPSVCVGKVVPLEQMPDEAFSSGMLGVGYAIEPDEGRFFSPVSGVVESVTQSKHAYTLQSDEGLDILIHIGVDTVQMGGDGFEALVKEGQRVRAGEELARADLARIRAHGLPTLTAVLIANPEKIERAEFRYGAASTSDAVMCFRLCKKG